MFEKGKWYVNPNWKPKSIMKFSNNIGTKLYFTEAFKEGKNAINDKWWSNSENKIRLATQEEIQQYLPDNHPDKIKVTQENYQIINLNSQEELEVCEKYFDNLGYKRTPTSRRKISEGTFFTIYNNIKEYQNLSSDCLYPKITLRDLGIETKVTQEEFKVGDWVIATIGYVEYLVKLTKLNPPGGLFKVLNFTNKLTPRGSFEKIVRKAKLEEIPVKDLSNEEILEIAKQYYPIGTKFKSLWSNRHFKVLNSDIRFEFNNNIITVLVDNADTEDGYAAVWDKDKNWAEIISTSQEVKDDFVFSTELINKRIEELESSNEIYIPTITKQKKKIDYTINSVFADIKVNLPEKPKKIVKPIVLEKFNLII